MQVKGMIRIKDQKQNDLLVFYRSSNFLCQNNGKVQPFILIKSFATLDEVFSVNENISP